ncbi:hypothetical protein C8R44DRAFT_736215 [Mycena epipterygia]|nr:hypothetical protein C8R44DRAFT_736215 [Mycena epipterygia]
MADSDSESDGGLVRTFDIPGPNATQHELREVLKNSQLEMGRLVVENRELRVKLAAIEARNSGKKKKEEDDPSGTGYLSVIKTLGKKYGFMEEPWLHPAVFTARAADGPPPHATPAEIDTMFKSEKLIVRYITSNLYDHIPTKYHELVDASTFPDFRDNFIKHLNAGRSSAANTLKTSFSRILADLNITSKTPGLLYHPGDDTKLPPTAYPPIFYSALKKNAQTALRSMIFGTASVQKQGSAKPQANTLGYIWELQGLTIGSICFTLIVIIRVLSGLDVLFEETGKISKIPYLTYFRQYKKMLMKNKETPGVRNIIRFWTKIVFTGVPLIATLDDKVVEDDEAEAAEEAEFAAAFDDMRLGDVDFDFGDEAGPNEVIEPEVDATQPDNEPALEEPVPLVAVRGRGRGQGSKRARGSNQGHGRKVVSTVIQDSPSEGEEEPPQAQPRRRASRR